MKIIFNTYYCKRNYNESLFLYVFYFLIEASFTMVTLHFNTHIVSVNKVDKNSNFELVFYIILFSFLVFKHRNTIPKSFTFFDHLLMKKKKKINFSVKHQAWKSDCSFHRIFNIQIIMFQFLLYFP